MSCYVSSNWSTSPLEAEPAPAKQVQRIAAQPRKPPSRQVAGPALVRAPLMRNPAAAQEGGACAPLAQLVDGFEEDELLLTTASVEAFVAGLLCEGAPSPPTSPPSALVAASSTAPSAAHPHIQDPVRSLSTTLEECDSIGCDHRDQLWRLCARWWQWPRAHSADPSGSATFRTGMEIIPSILPLISTLTTFVLNFAICLGMTGPLKACDCIAPIAWVAFAINVPANALSVIVKDNDGNGYAGNNNDHLMACNVWAIFLATSLYHVSYNGVSNLLQVSQGLVEMSDETVYEFAWLSTSIAIALNLALVMTRNISHVDSVRAIYAYNSLIIIGSNTAFMSFGSSSRWPESFFDPGAFWAVFAGAAWYLMHMIAMSPAFRAPPVRRCSGI